MCVCVCVCVCVYVCMFAAPASSHIPAENQESASCVHPGMNILRTLMVPLQITCASLVYQCGLWIDASYLHRFLF